MVLRRRCAIYTRKSTDEGLDMAFNSLDAQREACEAYVTSQRGEGWLLVADRYDDGGHSGGSLERPALKRLLADIQAGKVDCVVVYKIDRLTQALMDFSKLVDLFEHGGTFVSVTQSFNTTSSMGRLTLDILLSFAHFERELGSERVRDKIAASKRRGLWTGGVVPLGYKAVNRQLIIEPGEAAVVQCIFQRFVMLRSITKVLRELDADGVRQRSGRPFDKVVLHKILKSRTYRGLTIHKKEAYPGQHEAIIGADLWNEAQGINREPQAPGPWITMDLPQDDQYLAPDGSEIRLLVTTDAGGLAHCTLAAGKMSGPVRHRTVKEIWYVVEGRGEVWRSDGFDEDVVEVEPGTALTIPTKVSFQFRALQEGSLKIVIGTFPAWPGPSEAETVPGNW